MSLLQLDSGAALSISCGLSLAGAAILALQNIRNISQEKKNTATTTQAIHRLESTFSMTLATTQMHALLTEQSPYHNRIGLLKYYLKDSALTHSLAKPGEIDKFSINYHYYFYSEHSEPHAHVKHHE